METRPYGSNWWGVALGLVATGAGLAAAEVVVGLVQGSASPVVPVGQVFIDHVPKSVKDWAIEQFGTNDKVVLITGALDRGAGARCRWWASWPSAVRVPARTR